MQAVVIGAEIWVNINMLQEICWVDGVAVGKNLITIKWYLFSTVKGLDT